MITAKKVLLLAVGGGNDAVSSLLAVAQLRRDHQFSPETLDVLCPLPEGATYHNLRATDIPDLHEIAANTYRTIGPKRITNFPEAKLSTSGYFHRYYGADLRHGSLGLLQVLRALAPQYDLVLCVDVGGDFIAQDSNQNLLSPYMDSTVAYAVQHLTGVSVLGMVLGLSLDGESTPEQARAAVTAVVPSYSGRLTPDIMRFEAVYYRETIRPIRRSQTGDLLTDYILEGLRPHTHTYNRKFHLPSQKFSVDIERRLEPWCYDSYILFDPMTIRNRLIVPTQNGLDWVRKTQTSQRRLCHELVSQTCEEVFVATIPDIFHEQHDAIVRGLQDCMHAGTITASIGYRCDGPFSETLP